MSLTARSWILGLQLKKLRESMGLTAEAVGKEYLRATASRVYSIESGDRTLNKLELKGLVEEAYKRPDLLDTMEKLRLEIESSRDDPIRDELKLHPGSAVTHELEQRSTKAYGFVPDQVPKLYQTREYMTIQFERAGYSDAEVQGYVDAGLARQKRFLGMEEPPYTSIIITEGALDRASHVEGQLEAILERNEHPRLDIFVVPNSVGPHPQFAGFTVMEFGEFPSVLWLDHITGGSLVAVEKTVQVALKRWYGLAVLALQEEGTTDMIKWKMQ